MLSEPVILAICLPCCYDGLKKNLRCKSRQIAIDVNFVFDTNISELCISACFACVCVLFFFSFFWIRKNQNKLTNSTAVHNITACLSPVSTDNS